MVKTCTFFSLVCYARLLSVGRLLLLRNVYCAPHVYCPLDPLDV